MQVFCEQTICKYCKPTKIKFWKNRKSFKCSHPRIGLIYGMKSKEIYGKPAFTCTGFEIREE